MNMLLTSLFFLSRSKQKKDVLQDKLSSLMHGMQRLPSLLFENPTATLLDLSLEKYEISAIEPMHDIGNHIKNLYEEIPSHFPKTVQQALKEVIEASFRGKTQRRIADYRLSLVMLVDMLYRKYSDTNLCKLFSTLLDVQDIL